MRILMGTCCGLGQTLEHFFRLAVCETLRNLPAGSLVEADRGLSASLWQKEARESTHLMSRFHILVDVILASYENCRSTARGASQARTVMQTYVNSPCVFHSSFTYNDVPLRMGKTMK